jgi:hypothetical protein
MFQNKRKPLAFHTGTVYTSRGIWITVPPAAFAPSCEGKLQFHRVDQWELQATDPEVLQAGAIPRGVPRFASARGRVEVWTICFVWRWWRTDSAVESKLKSEQGGFCPFLLCVGRNLTNTSWCFIVVFSYRSIIVSTENRAQIQIVQWLASLGLKRSFFRLVFLLSFCLTDPWINIWIHTSLLPSFHPSVHPFSSPSIHLLYLIEAGLFVGAWGLSLFRWNALEL